MLGISWFSVSVTDSDVFIESTMDYGIFMNNACLNIHSRISNIFAASHSLVYFRVRWGTHTREHAGPCPIAKCEWGEGYSEVVKDRFS